MKKIESLTGMRFIMTMVIVFSHMEFLEESSLSTVYDIFNNPLPAVDFFFLLSGFGLMYSRTTRPGTKLRPVRDAVHRIRKLYPLYLLTMAVSIPYSIYTYWLSGQNTHQIIQAVVRRIILCLPLLQSCTGIQSYSNAFNGVCWFLSSLFVLYILFPLLARLADVLCRSLSTTLLTMTGTCVLFLFCAAGMRWVQAHGRLDNLVYGSPYSRVFYFFTGMGCFYLWHYWQQRQHPAKGSATAAEFLAAGALLVWFITRMHVVLPWYIQYLLDFALAAALLVVLACDGGQLSRLLAAPAMRRLGNAAMYMYLLHYPIRLYVDLLVHTILPQPGTGVLALESVALFAVSIGAALVLYDRKTGKMST